ncbi:unnamed protein product [Sphagnum jensenii]
MSGTEDHDVYRVKQKIARPRKPDERIRIGARRSVHLPVYPTTKTSTSYTHMCIRPFKIPANSSNCSVHGYFLQCRTCMCNLPWPPPR